MEILIFFVLVIGLLVGAIVYGLYRMLAPVFSRRLYLCKNCYSETRRNDTGQSRSNSEQALSFVFGFARLYYSMKELASIQKTCEHCGGHDLIPMNSPEARDILHKRGSLPNNY